MTKRSRLYSSLARPSRDDPFGSKRGVRRSLEDAEYAVQLAEASMEMDVERAQQAAAQAALLAAAPSAAPAVQVAAKTTQKAAVEATDLLEAVMVAQMRKSSSGMGQSSASSASSGSSASSASSGSGSASSESGSGEAGNNDADKGSESSDEAAALLRSPTVLTEALERLAESYEGARDIRGAIDAYERLLALEPPSARWLPQATKAKRGVQELVLLSHRRGMADTGKIASGLQAAGESSRRSITARAILDVENVRKVVERDCDTLEALANRTVLASPLKGSIAAPDDEQPPEDLKVCWLRGKLATKSLEDLRVIRKIARSDINRLELTILRGDPLLTAIREGRFSWLIPERFKKDIRPLPSFEQRAPLPGGSAAAEELWRQAEVWRLVDIPQESEQGMWLREQFESGALPQDPLLVMSLLEQAKKNPQLVARLVREAKDGRGEDLFTRVPYKEQEPPDAEAP